MGEQVRSSILLRIKKAKYFSILCDKTTDSAKMEQLTLCVRCVDVEKFMIREDFLGFVEMESTRGLEIKKGIVAELSRMGLSLSNLCGQGYDGYGWSSQRCTCNYIKRTTFRILHSLL
ncbi:hypothetical protein RN001_016282 [Aquatica leii]|uniref:DUF4371 domain-containing protein n=1 Tax=Aquatica leii TaxID=1421715 RepID=A0AAN7SKD2_9COLE|nr:hypothetical protein RN001_016282 [Aquatica leii]